MGRASGRTPWIVAAGCLVTLALSSGCATSPTSSPSSSPRASSTSSLSSTPRTSTSVQGGKGGASGASTSTWAAPLNIDPAIKQRGTELASVSCPTTDFCMAVFGDGNAVDFQNGKWGSPVAAGGHYTYSGGGSYACSARSRARPALSAWPSIPTATRLRTNMGTGKQR